MMSLFSRSGNIDASHSAAQATERVASSEQQVYGTTTSREHRANHKEPSVIVKEKNKFDFLLPPPGMVICKPCQPGDGLTLGGQPITLEEFMVLSPDELNEHALMQHGQPVPLSQLIELLEMPEEFLTMLEDDDDDDNGNDEVRETGERTNKEDQVNSCKMKDACSDECCDLQSSCSG